MTKDEMKNRISMALKDPILQQGFEIICKENAELKEQNIKDCENFNKTMKEINKQWNNEHYQLTKAKEIIALGLRVCETSSIEYMNLYQKQAEQFLKGAENESEIDT